MYSRNSLHLRVALQLFALLFSGCRGLPHVANSTENHNSIKSQESYSEAVENAVYNALLEKMYLNNRVKLIVIRDQTSVSDGFVGEGLISTLHYVNQHQPNGITQEILDDFQNKNKQSILLENLLRLRVKYTLISQTERDQLHQQDGGFWNAFYARYPGSQGVMTLSRVGFNVGINEALVYVGNQADGKAGKGYYVLLVRKNDSWHIQHKVEVWSS